MKGRSHEIGASGIGPDFGLDFLLLCGIAGRSSFGHGRRRREQRMRTLRARLGGYAIPAAIRAAAALVLAAGLAGCGTVGEGTSGSAFTSPGKYNMYTCQDIERNFLTLRARQVELEQLMARASQGPGCELVNTIAYRGEYAQRTGELNELAKAKADKQCATESKFSSGRAVF
jgi:hypothetical protein